MSLNLHFASLSLGASVDQQTGGLSVFDIVEEIRTPQVPLQIQSMVLALSLAKTEPQPFMGKIFIHFLTPDGAQNVVGSGDVQVPAEQKRMKAVFRFGAFPIQHFGQHRFVLSWVSEDGNKEGEAILDFDVIQASQPPQGQGNPAAGKPRISH